MIASGDGDIFALFLKTTSLESRPVLLVAHTPSLRAGGREHTHIEVLLAQGFQLVVYFSNTPILGEKNATVQLERVHGHTHTHQKAIVVF